MEFQEAHPIGYVFLFMLGITALLLPFILFGIYVLSVDRNPNNWFWLGEAGAFIVGIGLFNFVAIIIKQYLGHLVSILSFLIGGIMVAISLHML